MIFWKLYVYIERNLSEVSYIDDYRKCVFIVIIGDMKVISIIGKLKDLSSYQKSSKICWTLCPTDF
jgi:hypothetical protein